MKTIVSTTVSANSAFRNLLSGLFHLELATELPDDKESWLDEDNPCLVGKTMDILERILWSLDPALGDKQFGGIDPAKLDLLHSWGFPSFNLPGDRAVIRTIKGKILVVRPY